MCSMKEFFGQHDVYKQHKDTDFRKSTIMTNSKQIMGLISTIHFDKIVKDSQQRSKNQF